MLPETNAFGATEMMECCKVPDSPGVNVSVKSTSALSMSWYSMVSFSPSNEEDDVAVVPDHRFEVPVVDWVHSWVVIEYVRIGADELRYFHRHARVADAARIGCHRTGKALLVVDRQTMLVSKEPYEFPPI